MTTPCDRERLRSLLADELPEENEASLSDHLATCPDCQRELESLAGTREWWGEVGDCLRDQPPTDEAFAADFAVSFLEPCEDPEAIGRIDDIEILEVIGRGGMGVVLKGFQRELGRYVAVKLMAPHLSASGSARHIASSQVRPASSIASGAGESGSARPPSARSGPPPRSSTRT